MKIDDATETLTRFFNDLIGTLVPGLVLVVSLAVMHLGPGKMVEASKLAENTAMAMTIVGLMFAVGHVLLAIFDHILQQFLRACYLTKEFDEENAKKRQSYVQFLTEVQSQPNGADKASVGKVSWDYHDLRNVALSVTTEGASLGRRFMFISLLCNGVGTAVILMLIDFLYCHFFAPKLLFAYVETAHWAFQAALMLSGALLLFKRAEIFYGRAMTTPFSIAIAERKFKRDNSASK